jgi:hypothetical protein
MISMEAHTHAHVHLLHYTQRSSGGAVWTREREGARSTSDMVVRVDCEWLLVVWHTGQMRHTAGHDVCTGGVRHRRLYVLWSSGAAGE